MMSTLWLLCSSNDDDPGHSTVVNSPGRNSHRTNLLPVNSTLSPLPHLPAIQIIPVITLLVLLYHRLGHHLEYDLRSALHTVLVLATYPDVNSVVQLVRALHPSWQP